MSEFFYVLFTFFGKIFIAAVFIAAIVIGLSLLGATIFDYRFLPALMEAIK